MDLLEFTVTRLPGIERGFSFPARPGLNILTGPNGSGKSSVARALAWLLWPRRNPALSRREVRARLQCDGRTLTATGAASTVSWSEQGQPAPAPELPPEHLAACYHLDILDLMPAELDGDDSGLARRLAVELSGGLDAPGLRESLFSTSGLNLRGLKRALEEARRRVRDVTREQDALERRRGELQALEREAAQARSARERRDVLSALRERLDLEQDLEERRTRLKALPAGADKIGAKDLDVFDKLQEDLRSARTELDGAVARQTALRDDLSARKEMPAAERAAARTELDGRIAHLQEAATQWKEARRHLAELTDPGADMAESGPDTVDLDDQAVLRLQDAWEKFREHRARAEGLRDLEETDSRPMWGRLFQLAVPGLAVAAGLALVLLTPDRWPWGAVLIVLGVGRGLALLPGPWSRGPASGGDLARRRRAAESARDDARVALVGIMQEHGLDLDPDDASGILLLDRVRAARETRVRLEKARAAETSAAQQHDQALAGVNARLTELGKPEVPDVETARGALAGLEREWSDQEGLRRDLDTAKETCRTLETRCKRYERDRDELFEALGLDPGRRTRRDLVALQEAGVLRDSLAGEIKAMEGRLQQLDRGLAGLERVFSDEDPRKLDRKALEDRIETEDRLAARAGEIDRGIGELNEALRAATRGHDLETALAEETRVEEELAAAWRTRLEDELGAMVLDSAVHEHQTATRPTALERAEDLFKRITGRDYSLSCISRSDGNSTFVVHDPDTRDDLDPKRLSTGTRTQLLLAVRMGFLSAQGRIDHPPLILDDALTASDPVRFAAAVAGLGKLSDTLGLQIICLCARPDEVEAWQKILSSEGLAEAHVIDLAVVRSLAAATAPEILDVWSGASREDLLPPDPTGLDAAAYGEKLHVPQPRLQDPAESLHLFFLLDDDLALLHRLLTAGVGTVRNWRAVRERLGDRGVLTADEACALETRIRLWFRFLPLWRQGRPPRVPPQVIEEVLASKAFLPKVQELREEVAGDAAELLAGLRNKRIKRFQTAKIDEMEAELRQAGYIGSEEPLQAEDVIRELTADSRSWPVPQRPDTQTIHLLVDRLAKTLVP